MSQKVLVPLAQGCEELEAVTIIDLLVRAQIEVVTAALDDNLEILCSRGVRLVAQTTLDNVLDEAFALVVLPGGLPGADYLNQDSRILQLLQRTHAQGGMVGAICAAPKVLISAGLLDHQAATGYPGVIDAAPAEGMTYTGEAITQAGRVVTSRGPGTAMDFALSLIESLKGATVRQQVEAALVR